MQIKRRLFKRNGERKILENRYQKSNHTHTQIIRYKDRMSKHVVRRLD